MVGDITCLATGEGWLYVAAVLDLATRALLGYAMADHMRAELVVDALGMAAARLPLPNEAIFHSDSEYRSIGARVPGRPDPHSDGRPSGSRCPVLPGVPDSHFGLTTLSFLGSVGR
ncbi:MAG TPA: DDE-type integrase/transposase/recombinase, partial [Mycobacteriales bacterium]|nr:DDE-type integrase/transposase/recombinase [Mycobacteriales bacterium]